MMTSKQKIKKYKQDHPEVTDEFNGLLQDDPDFNYESYELDEWIFDCCLDEDPYTNV